MVPLASEFSNVLSQAIGGAQQHSSGFVTTQTKMMKSRRRWIFKQMSRMNQQQEEFDPEKEDQLMPEAVRSNRVSMDCGLSPNTGSRKTGVAGQGFYSEVVFPGAQVVAINTVTRKYRLGRAYDENNLEVRYRYSVSADGQLEDLLAKDEEQRRPAFHQRVHSCEEEAEEGLEPGLVEVVDDLHIPATIAGGMSDVAEGSGGYLSWGAIADGDEEDEGEDAFVHLGSSGDQQYSWLKLKTFVYCIQQKAVREVLYVLGWMDQLTFVASVAEADLVLHRQPASGEKQFYYNQYRHEAEEKRIPFVTVRGAVVEDLQRALLHVFQLYAGELTWAEYKERTRRNKGEIGRAHV